MGEEGGKEIRRVKKVLKLLWRIGKKVILGNVLVRRI